MTIYKINLEDLLIGESENREILGMSKINNDVVSVRINIMLTRTGEYQLSAHINKLEIETDVDLLNKIVKEENA